MTDAPVSVERNDAVLVLSIDSPDERNALTAAVADELVDALADLGDTETRCVLVRGNGRNFCTGGDLGAHVDRVRGDLDPEEWAERMERTADAVAAVAACPVPTVAAVDGTAFSEGACLALACDLRLASTDARIGFGFHRFGQAAAAGATYLLPRVTRPDVAAELLFTGELLDAVAALERGLFTRVEPAASFDDELASLTAGIATGPTAALQTMKRLLGADHDSLLTGIETEHRVQKRLAETDDYREGVTAFVEQREPDFGGY